jgi:MFS family permease
MVKLLKNKFSHLPFEIWALTFANLFVAVATTMAFSVSPFFITSVLGLSMFSMGAMEGFTEALSQVSKLSSGISSDYFRKKKPTLIFGVFLAALSKPFFILANGSLAVMISKILERISNGVIATPRDAYVADICTSSERGAAYGVMMTGKTIGCVIGPLLVSCLMFFTEDYRLVLWIGFLPVLAALFIIWKYMQEANTKEKNSSQASNEETKISFKDMKQLPVKYWVTVGIAAIFMLARFSDGFLALRLKELGAPLPVCTATIGIFNFISVLCSYPIGRLSDKIGREKLLYFSYISLILCNICFIFAGDMWLGLLGVLLWGAQRSTSQILFTALIADIAPKKIIGTAIGIFYIVLGVSSLLAGSISGWIANTHLSNIFIFGFSVSMLALVMHTLTLWRRRAYKEALGSV